MQLLLQDKEKNFLRELKRAKRAEEKEALKRNSGETPPDVDSSEDDDQIMEEDEMMDE